MDHVSNRVHARLSPCLSVIFVGVVQRFTCNLHYFPIFMSFVFRMLKASSKDVKQKTDKRIFL